MANDILFKVIMCKGESGAVIESIEIKSSSGSTDIMEITLSDGSKVDFPVTNTLDDNHIAQVLADHTDSQLDSSSNNPISNSAVDTALTWEIANQGVPVYGWTSVDIDVTDFIDTAKEFYACVGFKASDNTTLKAGVLFPNKKDSSDNNDLRETTGYYYSSDYNGSFMFRFNRTGKTISLVKSWTHVEGNFSDPSTEPILFVEVYYR